MKCLCEVGCKNEMSFYSREHGRDDMLPAVIMRKQSDNIVTFQLNYDKLKLVSRLLF